MPYPNLLVDEKNRPIPQYYDKIANEMKPMSNSFIDEKQIITQDPITGVKTVTPTAAEMFAGASFMTGRKKLIVQNMGNDPVYWGNGTVTPQTGIPLIAGDSIIFTFGKDTPIYFIAETNVSVRVGELA